MIGDLIDLRCHAFGSIDPAFLRQIAFEKKIDLRRAFDGENAYSQVAVSDPWQLFTTIGHILKTPSEMHRMISHLAQKQIEASVIYAEVFMSPVLMGLEDVGAWRDHLAAIRDAGRQSDANTDISVVIELDRRAGVDIAKRAALFAAETADEGTAAIALSGQGGPIDFYDFAYCLDMAHEAGLQICLDVANVDELKRALQSNRFSRFANVPAFPQDPRIAQDLIAAQYGADCTMPRAKDVIEDWIKAGARIALASGSSSINDLNVYASVQMAKQRLNWDGVWFSQIMKDAISLAFCDKATKEKMEKRVTKSWTST
jgi:adenosine deaminase